MREFVVPAGAAVAADSPVAPAPRAARAETSVSGAAPAAPELPRATPSAAWEFPVLRTVKVPAGGNLQAALRAAKPGDEIRLAAGATFTGSFRLPTRCKAGQGITIRSDVPDPPDSARVTPKTAAGFAKIVTASSEWALRIDGPSCNVRLLAVELAVTAAPSINYGILWLGNGGYRDGGEYQTVMDSVPQNLVVDRVYVHGAPLANTRRCIALNSGQTAIVDSWVSDCHAKGDDSQAIGGWNGPGPYLIENNYLEGAGENVIFGGNDPGIAKLTPSDITVRRNHIAKQLSWKGGPWQIKNLLELKNAKRVLIEDNVFQNNWSAAQEGWAFIFASINQGGTAWGQHSTVQDVTFRWNVVDNSYKGIVIAEGNGSASGVGYTPAARIAITDNRWTRIGDALFLVASPFAGATFARNTSTGPTRTVLQIGAPDASARFPGFQFSGNRAGPAKFALNSPRGDNAALFSAYRIPISAFTRNCIVRPASDYTLNSNTLPGNTFVTMANLCWTNGGVDQGELGRRTLGVVVSP
jgi:hypothetical protein